MDDVVAEMKNQAPPCVAALDLALADRPDFLVYTMSAVDFSNRYTTRGYRRMVTETLTTTFQVTSTG